MCNSLIDYSDNGKPHLKKQSEAAKILAETAKELDLAYDEDAERWMIWEDNYWQKANNTAVLGKVDQEVENRTIGLGYSISYITGISAFLKLELKTESWNKEKHLLPMRNGILNLKTMELVEHTKELRMTWQLPFDYDRNAHCEPIIDWLHETVEHSTQVELLQAYLNCILLSRVELQRYLEIIGPGASGKSIFIRLAGELVGKNNVHSTELRRLEGDGSRFETARIYGKKLIIIPNAEKFAGDVTTLKAIIEQDPLPYKEKHRQGTRPNFRSQAMILMAANEPIQYSDYTSRLQRKRITINFSKSIPPSKQRDLGKEFEAYLPGLLNWVISIPEQRVTDLIQDTNEYIPSLEKTSMENLLNTNPMAAWLDEQVIYDKKAETAIGVEQRNPNGSYKNSDTWLYASYCEYCKQSNEKPVSSVRFSNLLIDLCQNQLHLPEIIKLPKTRYGVKIKGLRIRDTDKIEEEKDEPSPIEESLS